MRRLSSYRSFTHYAIKLSLSLAAEVMLYAPSPAIPHGTFGTLLNRYVMTSEFEWSYLFQSYND